MAPTATVRSNGLRVLVADADGAAARALAGRFRHQGFWAYPTTRGAEALTLSRAYPLALAVVDVRLADMPGCELAARLRLVDGRLPVVVTAADSQPESEVAARRAGIVLYAPKPLSMRRLRAVMRKAIDAAAPTRAGRSVRRSRTRD